MIALSQGRNNPKYDPIKADVFAFGIMLVDMIFKDGEMSFIYDYDKF